MKTILLQFFLINGCGLSMSDYMKYYLNFLFWMFIGGSMLVFSVETNAAPESLTYFIGSMGGATLIIAIVRIKIISTCRSLCNSCERKNFYITCKRKDYNLKYTPAVIRGLLGAYIIFVCIVYYAVIFIRDMAG